MEHRVIEKPIAELYRRIHAERLNGEIHIQDAHFTKAMYFLQGRLEFARTTVIQERLGEILYKLGKIDQTQFWSLHKLMEGRRDRLGQILVVENILDQATLHMALTHQVTTIAAAALALTSGTWRFSESAPEIPADSRFSIPLPVVVAAGMPGLANPGYFRNQFYEMGVRTRPLDERVLDTLDSPARQLYRQLDGTRDIACSHLPTHLSMEEDRFWRDLVHLYLVNGIECHEVSRPDKGMDRNVETLLSLYDRLNSGTQDHYQLLGLKDNADEADIKTAYFKLAKQLHPDRIAYAPDPDIKEKANFVFAAINRAFDTLSDPQKRRAYDSGEEESDDPDSRTRGNLKERARMLSQKARTLYNQQRFWEASALMDEAVRLDDGKAPYYLLLGMAQLHIPTLRRSAERNLTRATELDPWNADALTGLGILFQEENLVHRAEGFLRKALSINPDHKLARKRLDALTGKGKKRSLFGRKK